MATEPPTDWRTAPVPERQDPTEPESPHGVRRAASATGRGAKRVGEATGRAGRFTFQQARRASHAQGAGDSGLSRLIEMHAVQTAGDAAVAISLAGTLFFQVPTGEARSQVALFLGLTMLPFVVVAPLIGPFLDRYAHGRRWAIGTTMGLRAFLCWVLAGAVGAEGPALFLAALGVLISSKAYGVTRAAAVPRLLPRDLTLVRTNSRISLAGVVGVAISAPVAVGLSKLGPDWSLRWAFLLFVVATVLAILLPPVVDEAADQDPEDVAAAGHATAAPPSGAATPERHSRVPRRVRLPVGAAVLARAGTPASVVLGLRSNAGLRLLSGFLTLYLAFLLRTNPLPGWDDRRAALLALVIGAAGLGNTLGIGLGNVMRRVRPEVAVLAALAADLVATVLAFAFYGLPTLVLLGLTAGTAQGFAKLSLDALIQRDVPQRHRSRTFARSETVLQLSWVLGGFIGIALPLIPRLGLGVATAILLVVAFSAVSAAKRTRATSAGSAGHP